MQKEKKAKTEKQPTIKKNGLIDVKFKSGKTHEMHPDLAKKMVDRNVAEYL